MKYYVTYERIDSDYDIIEILDIRGLRLLHSNTSITILKVQKCIENNNKLIINNKDIKSFILRIKKRKREVFKHRLNDNYYFVIRKHKKTIALYRKVQEAPRWWNGRKELTLDTNRIDIKCVIEHWIKKYVNDLK